MVPKYWHCQEGGHRALERGQFRNFFFAVFFTFFCQYQIFRWLGTCLTHLDQHYMKKQDKTDIFPKPKVKNPKKWLFSKIMISEPEIWFQEAFYNFSKVVHYIWWKMPKKYTQVATKVKFWIFAQGKEPKMVHFLTFPKITRYYPNFELF